MSYADDIINGNFGSKKKKKKESYADQIVNGTFGKSTNTTSQEDEFKEYVSNLWQKDRKKSPNIMDIGKIGKGLLDITTAPVKWGANLGKGAVNTTQNLWNNYIDYAASGNLEKDAKNITKNTILLSTSPKAREEVAKKILVSGGVASSQVAKGTTKTLENWYDTLKQANFYVNKGAGRKLGTISEEKYQRDKEKMVEDVKQDFTGDLWRYGFGWDEELENTLKKNSYITPTNFGGQLAETVGQQVPGLILGSLGMNYMTGGQGLSAMTELSGLKGKEYIKAALGNMGKAGIINLPSNIEIGARSFGAATEEALQAGASPEDAVKYGFLSAAVEITTEWTTSGIPGIENSTGLLSKGAEAFIDKSTGKIKNEYVKAMVKTLMKFGFEATGEGFEEALSEIMSPIIKNASYTQGEKIDWNDVVYSTLMGMASGGFLNVANVGSNYNAYKSGVDVETGLSQTDEEVLDKLVQAKAGENATQLEKNKLRNKIQAQLQNEGIDVTEIEEAIGGEDYKKLLEQTNKLEELKAQKEKLDNSKMSELTAAENDQRQELKEQIAQLEKDNEQLSLAVYNDLINKTSNSGLLQKSYYNARTIDTDTSNIKNEAQKKTIENAKEAGIINKYKDKVETFSKLAAKQDTEIQFTTFDKLLKEGKLVERTDLTQEEKTELKNLEEKLKQTTNSTEKQAIQNDINDLKYYQNEGYKSKVDGKDVITINLDSKKATQKIVMHEFKHVLEKSNLNKDFNTFLFDYANKKGDLTTIQDEVKDIYKDAYGKLTQEQIDSEVSAKLIEKYLSDDDFVTQLGTKPTIRQKLKELIDNLISVFTPNSNEGKQLRELQKRYTELWNDAATQEAVDNGEQLSVTKQSKQMLEQEFQKLTGDNINLAEAKLAGYAVRQLQRENGNLSGTEEAPYSNEEMEIYNAIQNSKKTSSHLYHSTPVDRIQNIIQNGLQIGSKQNQEGVSSENKLYLSATEELADSFTPEGSVMLRISPNAKLENLDYDLLGGEGSYTITNNIDPKYLQVKENGKWVNLLKSSYANKGEQIAPFNNVQTLEQRVSGDALLDVQDLIEEIRDVGASVDENGYVTLYHQTSNENATKIRDTGLMNAKEDAVYFSTSQNASQADGRGQTKLEFKVPAEMLELDDLFDDNADVKIRLNGNKNLNVSQYLVNNDTTNRQYSLTKDNQGRKLTKEQQEFFKDSKVRDENGNLKVMYHGTPTGTTTVFRAGTYFTDNKAYADIYQNPGASSISSADKKTIDNPRTYEVYLNMTNPFDISNPEIRDIYINEYIKGGYALGINPYMSDSEYNKITSIDWTEGENLQEFLEEEHPEFDGLVLDEGGIGGYGDEVVSRGKSYVVFNPNQVKNVDNTNPTDNVDIRLSMTRNNDIAPENINGYELRGLEQPLSYTRDIAPTIAPVNQTEEIDLPFDATFDEVKEALKLNNDVDKAEYTKVSDVNKTTGKEYENQYSPFDKAKKDLAQKKLENFIEKETYKAIDKATNVAAQYGQFNKNQKKQIKEEFKRFANMSSEQLTNADTYNEFKNIISEYADREMNFVDTYLKEVKDDIRKRRFNVSELKKQITDYNDLRKAYFGRLNLSNEGKSIDSQWQELCEIHPAYFSPDITSEAEMLDKLTDIMDLDTSITEKYRLSDEEIDRIATKAFSTLVTEAPTDAQIEEFENEVDRALERKKSEVRRQQLLDDMGLSVDDIATGKDINALGYQRTDPIRLNEKVFGYEVGNKINDATIRQTIHNTAEKMRWQNQERNEIKELGIKARSKESAAVQKYGEGEYVNDLGEVVKYGDNELAAEFPNVETQEKIKHAAEILRGKYDKYIDQINDVLTDLGYDAIPKRENYFRHFMELNDKLSEWGVPFNRQTMNQDSLPTDINGLTDQFKPGKNWFASALERKGIKTTYDAITGIDGYIESAGNLIFHTEDIQRYRALAKLIRETYGQQHGLDNIDIMTEAEKNQRIEDIYGNKLSKYAAWLDEQANALAGKKAAIDRAVERMFGRKVYSAASTMKQQVGSNLTGFNVRSAMTNFASVVQAISKTKKIAFLKGTISTINNMIHNDGMTEKSDFLMGRYGTEQLSQKNWQKLASAGQIFMEGTDHFTSNQIWRSKYFENLSKGMTEEQAIRNADDFAARVMGNRVQGATAEIFNSKTLGFLTQFQLEVNNQWSNIVHDNKIDLQSGNKTAASVVFQLGQLAAFSYIFNGIMKGLTGSDVMFDPIELLKKLFNPDDDDKDKSMEERAREVFGDILNQLPMSSIFTGGRIPIQEAFKGAETGFKYLTGQENEYGQKYTASDVFDDSLESLAYLFMPTGYGQLRKTYKGTVDMDYDVDINPFDGDGIDITKRPIRGSYTDSGNLRFTGDNSFVGRLKNALFGQYASEEAQKYVDSGYKTIDKKKIPELKELDMTSSEYRKYRKGLTDAGTKNSQKIDYIDSLNVPTSQKNIMASNVLKRDVDMSGYDSYSSYEEFDYAYKHPEKYNFIKETGISYSKFKNNENVKEAVNWAYNNPTSYSMSKVIGGDVVEYKNYVDTINNIKADKDKNGNSINGTRKTKVFEYVNSLDLTATQKAMLIKSEYSSFDTYNNEIVNYLNNATEITLDEEYAILKQLGYKIKNDTVSW